MPTSQRGGTIIMELRSGTHLGIINPCNLSSPRIESALLGKLDDSMVAFFSERRITPRALVRLQQEFSMNLERFVGRADAVLELLKQCCGNPRESATNTRWLSAEQAAPLCRAFNNVGLTMHGKLICSFVWDNWNVSSDTHSHACACYLGNHDRPMLPPESVVEHLAKLHARFMDGADVPMSVYWSAKMRK